MDLGETKGKFDTLYLNLNHEVRHALNDINVININGAEYVKIEKPLEKMDAQSALKQLKEKYKDDSNTLRRLEIIENSLVPKEDVMFLLKKHCPDLVLFFDYGVNRFRLAKATIKKRDIMEIGDML